MARRVVVIASGETERRALPHLLRHVGSLGVSFLEVRIPPRQGRLNLAMAERLVRAAWFELLGTANEPEKFVVLLDTDGKSVDETLAPIEPFLPGRLQSTIRVPLLFAYAQWHLEAWCLADDKGLREFLGRAVSVDPSNPDQIQSPKHYLTQLLPRGICTAAISENIA